MYTCIFSSLFLLVPSEPRNLSYVNVSASSIRVSWDPPLEKNGIILSYTLEYTELLTNTTTYIDILPGSEQERVHVLIEQLMEYDEYTVRVAASTDKGPGSFSRTLNVLTAEHGMCIHGCVCVRGEWKEGGGVW